MSPLAPDRVTNLFVSGGQLILMVAAIFLGGILAGQRWPTGRLALPAGWKKAIWSVGGVCLAAPALGFVWARMGHTLTYDQVDFLDGLFVLGVGSQWFAADRKAKT